MAVEAVPTKHQDPAPIHVIFVATRAGLIKKLSFNPRTGLACLVEVLQPFASGRTPAVHSLRLLEATSSLYLATSESVLRVSTQRCARFATQAQCLGAMDPYCGWNRQKEECTTTPNKNPRAAYWLQDPIACPRIDLPVGRRPLTISQRSVAINEPLSRTCCALSCTSFPNVVDKQ